jgi:hypothetical protein
MNGYDLARLFALIGAVAIVAPALYFLWRDRDGTLANPVFWMAFGGVGVLLWTAIWQPS